MQHVQNSCDSLLTNRDRIVLSLEIVSPIVTVYSFELSLLYDSFVLVNRFKRGEFVLRVLCRCVMGRKLRCFYENSGKTAVTERKAVKSVTFKLLNTRIIQGLSVENVRQMS